MSQADSTLHSGFLPNGGSAIAERKLGEITVASPQILAVAQAFNMAPQKLLVRVKNCLPAVFEQHVYLEVAHDFRIHPETMAKILAVYRAGRPLSESDLERRPVGQNTVSNTFGDFADFFECVMNFIKLIPKEYPGFAVGAELAADIVVAYGKESPERVIEMIAANLDEMCEYYNIQRGTACGRLRTCVYRFMRQTLPRLRARGIPDLLDVDEILSALSSWKDSWCLEDDAGDTITVRDELRTLGEGDGYGD